ncbi:membrane bound O-acyl transferase family protein [Ceratobasidium sp. AG-Ba]|nr:membrane bound O-acyl transferase family protein [Ceratobasidium sp. AG-Ba]
MWPDADARREVSLRPVLVSQLWYFLAIYFTINPRLFHLRLWLIPPALVSTWSLCVNYAFKNPSLNSFNFGITSVGGTMALKLIELATLKQPPKCDGQIFCSLKNLFCWNCVVGASGYMGDPRCLHWDRSGRTYAPTDTRRDTSHAKFYLDTFVFMVKRAVYADILLAFLANLKISESNTIFRDTFRITNNHTIRLPHPLVGAIVPTLAFGLLIMNVIELANDLGTLLAARSSISQPASSLKSEWPPLFDHPYRATSLRDFWTNRWQGTSRRTFSRSGGRLGSVIGESIGGLWGKGAKPVVSRIGYVMGTFLVSGLIHDIGTWGMGGGMDFWRVTGYFLVQGVGIVAESALQLERFSRQGEVEKTAKYKPLSRALYRCLAKVWVPLWVVLPATMMAEAWLERGFASATLPYSPTRALLHAWNHFAQFH